VEGVLGVPVRTKPVLAGLGHGDEDRLEAERVKVGLGELFLGDGNPAVSGASEDAAAAEDVGDGLEARLELGLVRGRRRGRLSLCTAFQELSRTSQVYPVN